MRIKISIGGSQNQAPSEVEIEAETSSQIDDLIGKIQTIKDEANI